MPIRAHFLFCFCALVILGSMRSIDAAPTGSVAQISVSPTMVQWKVLVPSESLTLTVTAPNGETYSFESKSPVLGVTGKDLGGAADGTYIFQLVVTPPIPTSVKQRLKDARKINDDAAARKVARDAGFDRPVFEAGAFSVLGGAFVSPDVSETPSHQGAAETASSADRAPATRSNGRAVTGAGRRLEPVANDQVIADDLIVQGSACIGLDCVNNESFGFDTVRLKENNTRIKFDDTSSSPGFPATDWQLTANDSASGGANKFSVEDVTSTTVPFTILGAAPSNSVFVNAAGKVGLRTSTPALDIHMQTTDTPAVRFDQTSGGGFTAQTWDIGANEANWFVRDVTGGSRLPLRIRPGAPTSSIDIAATGNVGVGTASPSGKLHVVTSAAPFIVSATGDVGVGTTTPSARLNVSGGGVLVDGGVGNTLLQQKTVSGGHFWDNLGIGRSAYFRMSNVSQVDTIAIAVASNGNIGLGGTTAPTSPIQHSNGAILTAGGVWQNASSRELKQDIYELNVDEARDTLEKLDPVTFAYKIDPQEHHAGFIAEDVPDLVAAKDRKSLSAMDIVAVLTKVAQQQQKTIDQLTKRVAELESQRTGNK